MGSTREKNKHVKIKPKKIHVVAVSKTQTVNHLVILQIKGLSLFEKKNTKRNKSEMKGETYREKT